MGSGCRHQSSHRSEIWTTRDSISPAGRRRMSGDTLSKIAKEYCGDATKYPIIFEANQPMLTDPNKIHVGQVLRIPPLE